MQVLDSDVADLSDELLALEPVPFLRSHEARAGGPGRRGRARVAGARASGLMLLRNVQPKLRSV